MGSIRSQIRLAPLSGSRLIVPVRVTIPTPLADAVGIEPVFNAALAALGDVLNAVKRHYYSGASSFDAIAAHNGAATLLFVSGFGVRAREGDR